MDGWIGHLEQHYEVAFVVHHKQSYLEVSRHHCTVRIHCLGGGKSPFEDGKGELVDGVSGLG